jgi:chromosome partitioning protein
LGHKPTDRHPLVAQQPLRESLTKTETSLLELLPGSRSFRDVEMLAAGAPGPTSTLRSHLATGMNQYDFVLIDCPPSMGRLTETALGCSTEVLMPIQCEFFAMEGLTQMIHVIRRVMQQGDGRLQFGGIVLTMYDPDLELTGEVEEEVREFFGEIVFRTVVPRDVAVSEAPSHGLSVIDYRPRARGTRAYIELCMEVLERD